MSLFSSIEKTVRNIIIFTKSRKNRQLGHVNVNFWSRRHEANLYYIQISAPWCKQWKFLCENNVHQLLMRSHIIFISLHTNYVFMKPPRSHNCFSLKECRARSFDCLKKGFWSTSAGYMTCALYWDLESIVTSLLCYGDNHASVKGRFSF